MRTVVIGAHLRRDDIEPAAAALAAGGVFLSGVEVPDDQPLGDRALLLRVAETRAGLLDRATFIAIRYGFAARSEAEAAAKVAPHVTRWQQLLSDHRNDVEMTLKIAATTSKPRPDRRAFDSGASYLKALHEATQAATIDEAFRAAVEQKLVAKRRKWIHRDNQSMELVALVARNAIDEIRAAGEELKRDFPHVAFMLSGPWPLEVFADDDHE